MLQNEVSVGKSYIVKISSGKLAVVQLTGEDAYYNGRHRGWTGVNLATKRQIRVRTARKLRREATPNEINKAKGARHKATADSTNNKATVGAGEVANDPRHVYGQRLDEITRHFSKALVEGSPDYCLILAHDNVAVAMKELDRLVDRLIQIAIWEQVPQEAVKVLAIYHQTAVTSLYNQMAGIKIQLLKRGDIDPDKLEDWLLLGTGPATPPATSQTVAYPSEKPVPVGPCYSEEGWAEKRRSFEEEERQAEENDPGDFD